MLAMLELSPDEIASIVTIGVIAFLCGLVGLAFWRWH